jgi:hypothetical protein
MANPGLSEASSWLQFPSNFFSNFLRTWYYTPRTDWLDHFITINWNGGDAHVERHVLEGAGSYGLQLSCIMDAINVLVAHPGLTDLSDDDKAKLLRLTDLEKKIDSAIEEYRSNPAAYRSFG